MILLLFAGSAPGGTGDSVWWAVGALRERPSVIDGDIAVRPATTTGALIERPARIAGTLLVR